jgi:hypothetical protein
MRVFVEVNDKYLWTLKPFAYLFNIYWSSLQQVVVAGYSKPNFRLPDNFVFFQIDEANYPADRWSDGMIKFLQSVDDSHFALLLCDYWLCRTVDTRGVAACYDYIVDRPEVLRIDLTADRLYAGGMFDVESYGSYDIIETPHGTPYQMSTQAGIWNRQRFLELLHPTCSAWEVEIHTNPPHSMRVLGTRQYPVRYANALNKGAISLEQLSYIPEPHFSTVIDTIPKELRRK